MVGERIGNFRIVARLGTGGMGEVFLAENETIGTKVAIKMLQPQISSNAEHVQRFFNEALAASKIQHSGIGKIFDVGRLAGRAYLVMEFLDGETLAARIRRLGRLPLPELLDIGRQISNVLDAVHRAGITHRDLKPDNIFIVPDAELASGERVKILDFGIAKLTSHKMGLTATGAGAMGTPGYMSPEQWKNSKSVDWRADAYSLGCLTYEMATGHVPFPAETIGESCSKHLTEAPVPLASQIRVPPELDLLVARLLAKHPDQRPATMKEIEHVFANLASVAREQNSAPPPDISSSQSSKRLPIVGPRSLLPGPPQTTLGVATGGVATPRPQRTRARWIAPLAAVAVLATIGIVAAIASSTSVSEPSVLDAAITTAAPVVPERPPVAPVAPADAIEITSPTDSIAATEPSAPSANDSLRLHTECKAAVTARKWNQLSDCALKLKAYDAVAAQQFHEHSMRERNAEVAFRNMTDEITSGNYRNARSKLEDIRYVRGSVYQGAAEKAFKSFHNKELQRLAEEVKRKRDATCDMYNALMSSVLTQFGREFASELGRLMPCRPPPELAPELAPGADCDPIALEEQGDNAVTQGRHADALSLFEQAARCKDAPVKALILRAYMAACNSRNAAKAKMYFARLPVDKQAPVSQICIRNGIPVP